MDTMLVRTPIASYSYTDSSTGLNVRVCYQDKSGNIGQSCYDDKSDWYPGKNDPVGNASLNNGLAITGWDQNGREERVYYLDGNGTIVERCHSPYRSDWFSGELSGMFTAAYYSSLAVISYQAGPVFSIRIFYQDADTDEIRQFCRDGTDPWYDGHRFPAAIKGSSIASTYIPGKDNYLWLYYQKPSTELVGYIKQDKADWKQGMFRSQLRYDPGAAISAAAYAPDNHRVFTTDKDNNLAVTEWNVGASHWSQSKKLTIQIPNGTLGAAPLPGNAPWVRVYLQTAASQITEWGTNDGVNYLQMKSALPTN